MASGDTMSAKILRASSTNEASLACLAGRDPVERLGKWARPGRTCPFSRDVRPRFSGDRRPFPFPRDTWFSRHDPLSGFRRQFQNGLQATFLDKFFSDLGQGLGRVSPVDLLFGRKGRSDFVQEFFGRVLLVLVIKTGPRNQAPPPSPFRP